MNLNCKTGHRSLLGHAKDDFQHQHRRRRHRCSKPLSTRVITANASSTPLVDAVIQRGLCSHEAPFHVPGHKRGSRVPPSVSRILNQAMPYDLTELDGLDYLSSPEGPIQEAQTLAAAAWGASSTWFLVNGSTVGIHAAVMATCNGPKDALILPRNCHLSGYNAAVLAGCTPVHAAPVIAQGMAHHVTPQEIERAILEAEERGLRPRAVLVVSPTYFGILSDVAALAEVCRRRGVTLIVDEAHGAHLRFLENRTEETSGDLSSGDLASGDLELGEILISSSSAAVLPPNNGSNGQVISALTAGADIVIQSTHKQLGALTQGAMLHVRHGSSVDTSRISRLLQILQTSSPSYLVMASLDAARAQAQDPDAVAEAHAAATHINTWFDSREAFDDARNASKESIDSKESRNACTRVLRLLRPATLLSEAKSQPAALGRDPWRFTVILENLGGTESSSSSGSAMAIMTGWEAAALLESECGVVAELATHNAIVFAAGIGTTMDHATALTAGLKWLEERCRTLTAQKKDSDTTTTYSNPNNNHSSVYDIDYFSSSYNAYSIPHVALTPREALDAKTETVPSSLATGRISAELLCPYPPGIPAICPGELIPEGLMEMLQRVKAAGGKVVGAADGSLDTVRVVV